jgi:hypothetical protein
MPDLEIYPENFRSVQELLFKFYGGRFVTIPLEADFTIGTTATPLTSTAVQPRVTRLISNTGSTNFAISFLPGVTLATGILVQPGGTFSMDWYYDGDLLDRPLYAISAGAGGTLHMLERVLNGA